MAMINKFTFYKNYYEIINYLPNEEKVILYDAILKYMFEDIEPELDGLLNGIWINLKMPLDTNKKNIKNGLNGGRPKGKETQNKTQVKPKNEPKSKANNISYFLFLISNNNYKYIKTNNNLFNKIKDWLNYKEERKEIYKQTGLQSLLKQIENKIDEYGEEQIINLIDECMASNYKGIIFDRLKNKTAGSKKEKPLPDWFGKEYKEELTDETRRILQEIEEHDNK